MATEIALHNFGLRGFTQQARWIVGAKKESPAVLLGFLLSYQESTWFRFQVWQ
jgi:hypothetical protein